MLAVRRAVLPFAAPAEERLAAPELVGVSARLAVELELVEEVAQFAEARALVGHALEFQMQQVGLLVGKSLPAVPAAPVATVLRRLAG